MSKKETANPPIIKVHKENKGENIHENSKISIRAIDLSFMY